MEEKKIDITTQAVGKLENEKDIAALIKEELTKSAILSPIPIFIQKTPLGFNIEYQLK